MIKIQLVVALQLLESQKSITFVSKWYQGTTYNLQINDDKTFADNWTCVTNNVLAYGLTLKNINEMKSILTKMGYTETEPIKY